MVSLAKADRVLLRCEPRGMLFEIATDPPGFATDEDAAALGTHLMLPPQYERRRSDIERVLPAIRMPA